MMSSSEKVKVNKHVIICLCLKGYHCITQEEKTEECINRKLLRRI